MKKIKVAVIGSTGRMGQALHSEMQQSKKFQPFMGISSLGKNTGFHKSGKLTALNLKSSDVVIDFSTPETCLKAAKISADLSLPFVSGTTGLSKLDFETLQSFADKIPVFWSANMSPGIALLSEILRKLPRNDFEINLLEWHHRNKKDAPSGTALSLKKTLESGRHQVKDILSLRAGGAIGMHQVILASQTECLMLEHQVWDRKVFAQGALHASAWLIRKKPGFYEMRDLF